MCQSKPDYFSAFLIIYHSGLGHAMQQRMTTDYINAFGTKTKKYHF